jgi:hypothetical protein
VMGRFGQGAGYVGGPTMAMIALKCPQIEVIPAAYSSHTRHARSAAPVQTSGRMLWTWDTANPPDDRSSVRLCMTEAPTPSHKKGRRWVSGIN